MSNILAKLNWDSLLIQSTFNPLLSTRQLEKMLYCLIYLFLHQAVKKSKCSLPFSAVNLTKNKCPTFLVHKNYRH